MEKLRLIPFEEIEDRRLGKIGTPRRDAFEARLNEELETYHIGEAIKKTRIEQNLTQEELGQRIGVKKAQISKIERGHNISITSLGRIFKALGIKSASLDLGSVGKVALW
ncbi:MAG: helix-turn-helix domain-containing protein [Muribaculaceae bacterium]|nr:helix-turn-helix domain-containing protein [Muribaculaceae bacterium]